MKTKVSLLAVIISAFLIFSCGEEKKDSDETIAMNYKLEIFDSLQIDVLSRQLWVADVDTETGDLLILQPNPPKIWLFDKDLNVKAELDRPRDDPEGPGEHALSATFFDDGIAILGWYKVTIYDRDFNFKKAMIPNYPAVGLIMSGFKNIYDFTTEEDVPQLVTYYGQPQTNLAHFNKRFYDIFNIVDVVNPADSHNSRDSVFIPIGELTADSRYRNGNSFYMLQPRFNVSENKLFYALNTDTTLFVRNLPEGEIIESYTIPFDKFILNDGDEMGMAGARRGAPKDMSGNIETVYHTGDFEVVAYQSGMKLSEMEQYDRNSPDYYDQLQRVNFKKYLVIKDGQRVNSDLKLDPRVFYLEFVDDDGIFYGMQDTRVTEEEPEFYTIYKLKIVPDEN